MSTTYTITYITSWWNSLGYLNLWFRYSIYCRCNLYYQCTLKITAINKTLYTIALGTI